MPCFCQGEKDAAMAAAAKQAAQIQAKKPFPAISLGTVYCIAVFLGSIEKRRFF